MEKEVKSFDVAMEMIDGNAEYLGSLYHVDDERLKELKDFCEILDRLHKSEFYSIDYCEIEIDDDLDIIFTIGTNLMGACPAISSTEFYDLVFYAKDMELCYDDEMSLGDVRISLKLPGVWKIKLRGRNNI